MMKIFTYIFMLIFLLLFMDSSLLLIYLFNLIYLLSFMYLLMLNYNFNWMMIYNWFGLDNYSFMFNFLVFLIIGLVFMVSINFKMLKFYSFIILILMLFLMLSFSSMNFFLFYLFFEISLIPTFMLIMGWGYQPERINASMYMLLYTMFASLPLMILLYYLYYYYNSLNYLIMLNMSLYLNLNELITYFYMMFAFLVKLPLFMFHLWLPKAHIEAPVSGSMILASILLKLGGYGCIRSMMMMVNLSKKFNIYVMIFCLVGMIYLSLLSLRCMDFKLIVAYSSVVHMGMMLLGLMSLTYVGFMGGLLMMLGHGFCSSALFMMVNIFYFKSKSRNFILNKGMLMFMPSMLMWWFLFCINNMASPVSLNLISEILILISMFSWLSKFMIFLSMGMYFSSFYSLYLFSYIYHGKYSNLLLKFNLSNVIEYMILIIHWIPLNFLILKMELFN